MERASGIGRSGRFTASAQRLSEAGAIDGGVEPPRDDLENVQSSLLIILFARFGTLGEAELCDIVDEAIEKLVRESRRQGHALENPAGWVRTVAVRLAIDRIRALSHESPLESEEALEDDLAERLFERVETDDEVKRGLHKAVDERDELTVRIVGDWLDLADETGESPSSRTVAERCGYSHTTVQTALKNFARYLT